MKAEPAKAEHGREEGKEERRKRRREGWGAAEQSSRDPDKKNRFSFLLAAGKDRLMFLYNKQSSLSKTRDREKAC